MKDTAKDSESDVSVSERDTTIRGLAVGVTLLGMTPLVDASVDKCRSEAELIGAETIEKSGKVLRFLRKERMLVGQGVKESRVENRRETKSSISSVEMQVIAHESVSECQPSVGRLELRGLQK